MIKELTSDNFKETINTNGKILVDFHATWCGPCRMLKPILDKVSNSYNIASFDIDLDANISSQFGIRAVPTLILFENGKEVTRLMGMASESTITKLFQ